MTGRANKDKLKRTLPLPKSKKRSNIRDGASASSTATTPITSFFSCQPPPKLACPLCGQLVPRFKINQHIDFECQNFERSEGVSTFASNVSSAQLSPRENTPSSPKPCQEKDEDNVKEQTSPYFKKNDFEKSLQETTSKSVVRVLDLGSLSAKLSRKSQKIPEATQKVDAHLLEDQEKETLNSSQKENLLQRYEDTKLTTVTSAEASAAAETQPGLETGHNFHRNASGYEEKPVTTNQNSSSTLTKRKVAFSSKMTGFQKKAKHDRVVSETEETTRPGSPRHAAERKQPKIDDPSSVTIYQPQLCSESDKDAEKLSDDSLQASGVESNPERDVNISQPTQLPYYLQNFCFVLKAVLENEEDRALFDQHDMSHIQAFEKLSGMLKYHCVLVGKK